MATTKATNLGHRSDVTLKGTTTTIETDVVVSDTTTINNAGSDVGLKINSTSTGHIMQLQDGGTDVMVVADGGNVGIGGSPTEHLSIEGSGSQSLSIYSTDTGSVGTEKTFIKMFGENTAGDKREQARISASPGHSASNAGQLILSTNNSSSVMTQRMIIKEDGKVGIGTDSPISPVHIKVNATDSIPTNPLAQNGDNNVLVLRNSNNSANYSGIKLETRTSGASAWLIANEWQSQYLGDLVFRNRNAGSTSAERMRISADGNVGIGASPAQTLHVKTSSSATPITFGVLSNATGLPAISLNGAYASTTMAGIYGNGATASNLYYTVPSGRDHIFSIADVPKMIIDDSGKVGINCTPTTGSLDLLQATESIPGIRLNKSTSTTTSGQVFVEFVTNGQNQTANGRIVGNGSGSAAFASWSDKRLKENITPLTNQLDLINSLKPVEFDWKSNGEHGVGFIAQEFQNVFPKQVSTDSPTEEQIDNEETGTMSIAGWSSTEAILVSAIQELSAKVTALENA